MGLLAFLLMLGFDSMFLAALMLAVVPLGMYRQAAFAVMKRNFVGYFLNPTGYVFLALFIVSTAGFAFWPDQFFASNLANFDQLNQYLPYTMLVIISAITMSAWSEEKRQGTDELLLTLPTTDLDIVLGKYFAAVFIFTVALLLSQLWNVYILLVLTQGDVDIGLLFTTYFGYWWMGTAMLAIGMVASFLTNNLTVGFILGVLFNVPLVLLTSVDSIVSQNTWARLLSEWGLLARFEPFGRGLISLASIIYFVTVAIAAIYLCLVLIGRRHWAGTSNSFQRSGHFAIRFLALAALTISLTLIAQNSFLNRFRVDASEYGLSSLSPETKNILSTLRLAKSSDGERSADPIQIEAYIAPEVPSEYAQTRYDLLTLLREFDALGGSRLQVTIHNNVEPFSEMASLAEQRFGIKPVKVRTRSRGTTKEAEVIMGAVFTCNLERVVVPFFEYGMPVEYELIRSINTVAKARRKVIGVVDTDVMIAGGEIRNVLQRVPIPKSPIVEELEKQYTVNKVDPSQPINVWIEDTENPGQERLRYDALLVVQPSSLSPLELDHVVQAMKQGQPTAVFEDPVPFTRRNYVSGTNQPNPLFQEPVGDMTDLWDALHVRPISRKSLGKDQPYVIWQAYNPYPEIDDFNQVPEFVFVRNVMTNINPADKGQSGTWTGFPEDSEDPEATLPTKNLEELIFQFSGAIRPAEGKSNLRFTPLVQTGFAGRVLFSELSAAKQAGEEGSVRGTEDAYYTLAARIKSQPQSDSPPTTSDADEGNEAKTSDNHPMDVIYVADMDCLDVLIRNQPEQGVVVYRMQNLVFILNLLDSLTSETEYINIRSRVQTHRTLKTIEEKTDDLLRSVRLVARQTNSELEKAINREKEGLQKAAVEYRRQVRAMEDKKRRGDEIDELELIAKRDLLKQEEDNIQKRLETKQKQLVRSRDEAIRESRRLTDLTVQKTQDWYKWIAVLVPPIPLIVIGMGVFAYRRLREREGVSKNRLK
ncbi:MAG: Gldg family protein [Planctomycetota bacterium]|nr:Gldg family protein [Planctomycetota bacterium]MEE3075789.1 Gldg family protein [Planctomycetota bacterium]